jgi:flagellar motor protein MotB
LLAAAPPVQVPAPALPEQQAPPRHLAQPSAADRPSGDSRSASRHGLRGASVALSAVILSLVFAFSGGVLLGEHRSADLFPVPASPPEVLPSAAPSLVEALPAVRAAPRADIPPSLRAALHALPGFEVTENGDSLVVIPAGLFDSAAVAPRHSALASLTALRTVLASAPSVDVRVEGATDDRPVGPGSAVPSNVALAIRRAVTVSALIGGGPGRRWSIGVAENSPFPNDSAENRARNRTVRIVLSPGGN